MYFKTLLLCLGVGALTQADQITTGNIVELTVVSAILSKPYDSFVKIYGVNSKHALKFPINKVELFGLTYVEQITPSVNGTRMPNFHYNMGLSADLFTVQTYVAFEVWDAQARKFIGGLEMTVSELESNQADTYYEIVDENGEKSGLLNVAWNYGRPVQNDPKPPSSDDILDLVVTTAKLTKRMDTYVKIYCLDWSPKPQLPLTSSQLHGLLYLQVTTQTITNSRYPVWNIPVGLARHVYFPNSYLAFEVWELDDSNDTFVGGFTMTIERMETFPRSGDFVILDKNGNNAGYLGVQWSSN